jgi:hypothetical protein
MERVKPGRPDREGRAAEWHYELGARGIFYELSLSIRHRARLQDWGW